MSNRILILDDNIDRLDLFTKIIGYTYSFYYTAEDLLSSIRNNKITAELLLLDHDLGPTVMDGSTLANILKKENLQLPTVKRIIIHSMNPIGTTYMANILKEIYQDKVIKVLPVSRLNDLWNSNNRDKEFMLNFLLSLS